MDYIIRGGRVIDPSAGVDEIRDLYIHEGKIAESKEELVSPCVLSAEGKVVAPGLIDLHCHLRDPGFTYKEDVESGSFSAVAGGFTAVCCMPNTHPTISTPDIVRELIEKGERCGKARVLPIASVSANMCGEELTDFGALISSGAVAFSDDGKPVLNDALMRAALISAKAAKRTVISHCESPALTKGGCINEGKVSLELGVAGIPNSAEDIMIARDLVLAAETGAHIHIAHVSTASGIDMIRTAKQKGVSVTAETCPHYFALTEDAVKTWDSEAKMSPPLRTETDRLAVIAGICDGTIDVIATDHAPHSKEEKELGLVKAPNGIVGFETALSLGITHLVKTDMISLSRLIEMMTKAPADLIFSDYGTLKTGSAADLVIFDPNCMIEVKKENLHSKSKNMPYDGMTLYGKVCATLVRGQLAYENSNGGNENVDG